MSRRRVVITGVGACTPLGLDVQSTWQGILEGRSGVGPITYFDATECAAKIAAEVKGFEPSAEIPPVKIPSGDTLTQAVSPKDVKKMGRFIHLALRAGLEAYADSGLNEHRDQLVSERMGANIGVGMGGLPEIEAQYATFMAKGYRRISPFFVPQVITNMASGHLSMILDLKGPNLCNVTACSSSAHSLGESARMIQQGWADVMVSGGAESVVCPLAIGGFASMKALSTRNDDPSRASRPFDQGRDGFVLGEGSAILILEELEHAKKRGAKIYAEVCGYGVSGDAYHMTSPAPEGEGGRRAMAAALEDSGLAREKIHYVNAHGTSTPTGDAEEAVAIARTFPSAKEHLHVSSTKSMTGHLLGAAGAVETLFCMLAIRDQLVPPTINLDELDPKCRETGLDFTANEAVKKPIQYTLSNSFGFGGTNASIILGQI